MRYPKQVYSKKCVICNTEFSYTQYYSVEKTSPKKTCSRACMYKLTSRRLSGRFIPNGANEKNLSKWKISKCKECRRKINHKTSLKRTFCSRKCKAEWQKKNQSGEKNPNWKPRHLRSKYLSVKKSTRNKLIRERKVCEVCGITLYLEVHHIDRDRSNNLDDNLKLLCNEHHAQEHERRDEIEIARLIRVHPRKLVAAR